MTKHLSLFDSTPSTTNQHKAAEALRLHLKRQQTCPPFTAGDVTAGMENELQVAVSGTRNHVDLPISLEASNYYNNLLLRAQRGELPEHNLREIKDFLDDHEIQVWENSWVRFPKVLLGIYTRSILQHDFSADKNHPEAGSRGDLQRFLFLHQGEEWLRIPVSYLLKLSLGEAVSQPNHDYPFFHAIGQRLMRHFISDNISPEITSFTLSRGTKDTLPGSALAQEGSRRFFFIQLLLQYAEKRFQLDRFGQQVHLYFAPNPPERQKQLNAIIPDGVYRELFLNPCLSGWPRGEEKRAYMALCHRTLSRSQLNTIAKLKEAGILCNNLIILPNTSSTALANNGSHITLASKSLTASYARAAEFPPQCSEKYFGDLIIKLVEHFLPLFVGTYSAAPRRIGFADFHPEKVLGFLPHELESSHLRMIWRRWKKKASLQFFGHNFTPMGPLWLDTLLARCCRLQGDYLPDVRLLDYLVALQSQETAPGLNGVMHNQELLKQNLAELGIFDPRMAMYLPFRMRDLNAYGFHGFEGRHYSLFPDMHTFLARAANMQAIVTAIATNLVLEGKVTHQDIPDDPFTESERRQIFFISAIGVPTLYVRANTGNKVLQNILIHAGSRTRSSRRYKGYIRVPLDAYRRASLAYLRQNGSWFLNHQKIREEFSYLESIFNGSEPSAAQRLTVSITGCHNLRSAPMKEEAALFNRCAEQYYRGALCSHHMQEGLETFVENARQLENTGRSDLVKLKEIIIGQSRADRFIAATGKHVLRGTASEKQLHQLLLLFLLIIEQDLEQGEA
ncbi:hypothetical protein [Desulfogranum japonicum]|uniref:hypothetical protein n=1 Tax=Desulfogranum japonicum TaxID=231447 RepID=UPI0012947D76|nr:hypothetical protein [Desulfogranum japonicum]